MARRVLESRGFTVLSITLGVVLRLWWTTAIDTKPLHDSKWYWTKAVAIAAGNGYQDGGKPTAYWPVGYPATLGAALAMFGRSTEVAQALNVVIAAVTLVSVAVVAPRLGFSRVATNVAVLLLAVYPSDVGYTALVVSEPLFNALMLAAIAAFVRPARVATRLGLAGALFALAILTRSQGTLLPAIVALFAPASSVSLRQRITWAAGLYVVIAIALTPWWLRNLRAFSTFVPLSNNGGVNLYIGNNPNADGGYRFDEAVTAPLKQAVPGRWTGGPDEVRFDAAARRLAIEHMARRPQDVIALWPAKLRALYASDRTAANWSRPVARDQRERVRALRTVSQPYYVALVLLGVMGILVLANSALRARDAATGSWLPLASIAYFTVICLVYFGNARFHHAIMPWLGIYAGYFVARTLRA